MAGEIGVLALQGDVSEHIGAFKRAAAKLRVSAEVTPVREADQIPDLAALVIPGGESTTISRLIDKNRMRDGISQFTGGIFATCAGMVLLAVEVVDDSRFRPLGILDISVKRNAFGRQKESFEADIEYPGFITPYRAVFIRAPVTVRAGPHVQVLASVDQGIVAVRQGKVYAFAFHPELSPDLRIHEEFLRSSGLA